MQDRHAIAAILFTASLMYPHQILKASINPPSQLRSYTKSQSAKLRIKTSIDDFAIWLDETKWKQEKSDTAEELHFSHVNGKAWATVLTNRIGVPATTWRDMMLASAKRSDPNAKIIFEEERIVNGRHVFVVQISATFKGQPLEFLSYYHCGSSGSIEAVGFARDPMFADNREELTDFLNGLEILDKELTSPTTSSANRDIESTPGSLSVNSKITIKYDPMKWRLTNSDEVGEFTFAHTAGDGYAVVVTERISVPFDNIPDVVLSALQSKDPNASLVFKEKRRVNGVDVWLLKADAEVNKIPLSFCGYYYSGKSGTVQVVTFTGKNLRGEFEKDFLDFLNGLWISE